MKYLLYGMVFGLFLGLPFTILGIKNFLANRKKD